VSRTQSAQRTQRLFCGDFTSRASARIIDAFREMPCMRRVVMLSAVLFALPSSAFATWSIVAADRSTGRVVIASATCVDQNDEFLKGVQAVVVPGKGVAACQA